MKLYAKVLSLLTAAAFLICSAPALAESENTVPSEGDKIAGFTVTEVREYDPLNAKIVYLTHDKTGGPVMWIANDDTERSFQIAFRTHYDTETGVPHVFEHAALSGSKSYPDAGLLFSMMSNTCQTYLNAGTLTYMTIYPCASISDKQLLKFADIYLAGVFEPLVLTDAHAMQREAYRYGLVDADSDLTLTGTVYTEMLGAYYQNEAYYAEASASNPGSWHGICTGGVPGVIEEMTQQDLIDFHDTYYQPSNALTILYGDLNLEDFLTLIAGYYDRYDAVDVSTADPGYTPYSGQVTQETEVSASADATAETTLYYDVPVRGLSALDAELFSNVISSAIYNSSSALYNLMMQTYPTSRFSVSFDTSGAEPQLKFKLEQAPEDDNGAFAATVQQGIKADLEEGIKYDDLNASLKQLRISSGRTRESSAVGVSVSSQIMAAYALYGSLDTYFDVNETILNGMEDWFASGIIEKVLTEQVVDAPDTLLLTLRSVPGRLEELQAEAAQKLVDKKAAMSADEIAETVAATKDFADWSASMSENSMIEEVNVVKVDELPEDVQSAAATVDTVNGVRYVTSEVENCGTITATLYLRADMIPTEQLTSFGFAVSTLGECASGVHSYDELTSLMTEYGIEFTVKTLSDGESGLFTPVVAATIDCLPEDFDNALALVSEVLTTTGFTDYDQIRYNCMSTASMLQMAYSVQPHIFAYEIGEAAISDENLYNYYTGKLPSYQYLQSVSNMDDAAMETGAAEWRSLIASLIDRNGLSCTVISSADGIAHAEEQIQSLVAQWPLTYRTSVDYAAEMEKLPKRIAITVPGSAAYNLIIASPKDAGYTYSPELSIMNSLVYDQLLIPIMRYTNGVYSPLNTIDKTETYILAYRDPSLTKTYEEVIPSLSGKLSSITLTDEQLACLVVNRYTTLALPKGPLTLAQTAVRDVLNNTSTPAEKLTNMEAYKNVTVESVLANGSIYDNLSANGTIISAAPASMIKANPDYFDLVIDWLVD